MRFRSGQNSPLQEIFERFAAEWQHFLFNILGRMKRLCGFARVAFAFHVPRLQFNTSGEMWKAKVGVYSKIEIEHQWWIMNHSDDLHRRALMITTYLDESATDPIEVVTPRSSPVAVVGGLILDYFHYSDLSERWAVLLKKFPELGPALHMKDFGKDQRLHWVKEERRLEIFAEVVNIIHDCRSYTVSATLRHEDYNSCFSEETRFGHSPYELCFIVTALGVGELAKLNNNYPYPIPFVVDRGNKFADQLVLAHQEMKQMTDTIGYPPNVGTLTFDDDENMPALQAADVVCWGARRKSSGRKFLPGTEPILDLLNGPLHHLEMPFEAHAMRKLEEHFILRRSKGI